LLDSELSEELVGRESSLGENFRQKKIRQEVIRDERFKK